jgi:hypothetical protein
VRELIRPLMLSVVLATGACGWLRGDSPSPAQDTAVAAPAPAEPVPAATASAVYASELRPLLQERCGRCHFPGGKMHARLPFDDEATVRDLGAKKLSTRIDDDEGRRILQAYFNSQ